MFTIDKYVVAESLEQAYELNKSRRNVIIGGMLWLKMGNKKVDTAIDISALGLNSIEENEECFKIGCMCTLRDVEINEGINKYFNGLISKSVESIVGVQMRNLATMGGSMYSRFGFSDILTALLALETYVELYKGGIVPLEKYVDMTPDNDILMNIIIKKTDRRTCYSSYRISATDLPVLTCAVSNMGTEWLLVHGARPMKAKLSRFNLSEAPSREEIDAAVDKAVSETSFGTNIRGSREYRQVLAEVLAKRNINKILNGGNYAD